MECRKKMCFRNSWISLSKGLGEMQTRVTLEMYEVLKDKNDFTQTLYIS